MFDPTKILTQKNKPAQERQPLQHLSEEVAEMLNSLKALKEWRQRATKQRRRAEDVQEVAGDVE